MATFIFAFLLLVVLTLGMALGVILNGRSIKGSCGGLNNIGDADQCMVCSKPIDRNSPLKDRIDCPRARPKNAARATVSVAADQVTRRRG